MHFYNTLIALDPNFTGGHVNSYFAVTAVVDFPATGQ
jgi:hypothetical protein